MYCLQCLKSTVEKECQCENPNVLIKKGRKYYYKGQAYSSNKWLYLMSESFLKTPTGFRGDKGINFEYLRMMFERNVRSNTFIRLLLPALILPFLGIITITFLIFPFFILERPQSILTGFFASFLLIIGIINLKRGIITKIKVIARKRGKRIIHQQISYETYLKEKNKEQR